MNQTSSTDVRALWGDLPTAGKVVLVSIVLGFVIRISSESSSTVNGVAECNYSDMGALGFGALAIVAGLLTLLAARTHPRRLLLVVVGLLGLAFGALHIARGTGSFYDCETVATGLLTLT